MDMKHYLLLRFPYGFLTEALFSYVETTFHQLADQVDGIMHVRISRNCVFRDSNMDLMVEMELREQKTLDRYLEHELHKRFVLQVGSHAIERCTFDCIEE